MNVSPILITAILAMLWFVVYWVVGGVIFAVIAVSHFFRLKKAFFSCMFVIMAAGAAYGAAWMSVVSAVRNSRACLVKVTAIYDAIPAMFGCATRETVFSGLLWFVFLLTVGIGLMFISQSAERPRPLDTSV